LTVDTAFVLARKTQVLIIFQHYHVTQHLVVHNCVGSGGTRILEQVGPEAGP